jgi:hypothetical protein
MIKKERELLDLENLRLVNNELEIAHMVLEKQLNSDIGI